MVVGSSGGPGFFLGTGTRAIGPGDNCKVCDVNAAFVYMPQTADIGPHGIVELKCFTGDALPTDAAHSIFVESEYFESPEFEFAEQFDADTNLNIPHPWENLDSDFSVVDEFVLHSRRIYGGAGFARLPFFAQTVRASFSDDEFVATTWIPGVFLCYAGAEFVLGGISGVESEAVRDTTLFRTHEIAESPEYVDAKPLRSPLFVFTSSSFPAAVYSHPNAMTITTTQAGSNGVIAARVGAIDLVQSPLSAGTATTRQLDNCDVNDRTLKQYRVAEPIFRDSQFFSYGANVRLELLAEQPFGQFALGNDLTSFQAFGEQNNQFFQMGGSRFARSQNLVAVTPRVSPGAFDCSGIVLRHELHDGRKTLPDEWHYAGNWPGTTDTKFAAVMPRLAAVRYTNTINFGTTSGGIFSAQQHINGLNALSLSDLYAVDADYERRPRKIQMRLAFARQGSGGGMLAVLHYRMVWETVVRIYRMPFRLFSAVANNGIATWEFGLEGSPELAATRSYVGHSYGNENHFFSDQKWRSMTVSGNREVSFGGRCALQFQ